MGSSGGGSTSGAVSYPAYMQAVHGDWLNADGVDFISTSITEIMNNALGNSPWGTALVFDPSTYISNMFTYIESIQAAIASYDLAAAWEESRSRAVGVIGNYSNISVPNMSDVGGITEGDITADVDAFANQLDDELESKVLPRFRRGMQDINAVVSSAFPIGQAVIEGMRNRDVAKHASSLRVSAASENARIDLEVGKTNLNKDLSVAVEDSKGRIQYHHIHADAANKMIEMLHFITNIWAEDTKVRVEAARISIVAMKEYHDNLNEVARDNAMWDLEVFQHGANLLASVSGGTAMSGPKGPSKAQSAIGGALSGAAAGAMMAGASGGAVAGPVGMAAGAVIGLAAGLL